MKLDDIKLGVSPLTGDIYMGTVDKKDPGLWVTKRRATPDVCRVLIEWCPPGCRQTITGSDGSVYEVRVERLA
jgi:hypothetical protein